MKIKLIPKLKDIKSAKKNWNVVKSSPYAKMEFMLTVKKFVVGFIIFVIAYQGFNIVTNYHARGFMGWLGPIIISLVLLKVCHGIYQTLDQDRKKIDYYKKNPHLINYCPTDVKADVNDILNSFKDKSEKEDKNKNGIISKQEKSA